MAELKIKVNGVWTPALPVGTPGEPGPQGAPGPVGPGGNAGVQGGAIPPGGVAGEHLVKDGSVAFETRWEKLQSGRILHKIVQGPFNGTSAACIWTVPLEARPYLLMFQGQGHASANGMRDVYLQMDGVLKANSRLYYNTTAQHQTLHTATAILTGITAGDHTFTVHQGGSLVSDGNDYGFVMLVPL